MVDSDPIRAPLEELQVMDDNAVTDPLPQLTPDSMPSQPITEVSTQTTRSRNGSSGNEDTTLPDRNELMIVSSGNRHGAEPSNAPFISWTDSSFQYTVQNLMNRGHTLLQLQYIINGYCTNSCAMYLNVDREEDKQIYLTLRTLLLQLENLWVESESGLLKTDSSDSLIKTIIPLTGCRRDEEENVTPPSTNKRKTYDLVSDNVRRTMGPPPCDNTVERPLTPPCDNTVAQPLALPSMPPNKKPCPRCEKLIDKRNVPRHMRSKTCSV